ncbi:MAG: hypothetical protein ACYDBJ_03950 [Aggregatilineales bacterium]
MSILALLLILISAAMHTTWNLLLKRAGERQIFLWWALVLAVVIFSPIVILQPLSVNVWPYVISSALAEAVYFAALTHAYRLNDFSLVYPIARGTAPFFLDSVVSRRTTETAGRGRVELDCDRADDHWR